MLSGDNQKTANAIAKQVGIDEAYGNLLPDEKIARVRELTAKYKHVGMIAILADTGATLIVIANALRLLRR